MNIEQEIRDLKRQISSWGFANRSAQYQRANNLRGSQVAHSQLIGAFHPVLSDFGTISTYELQSPTKSQLGLTIVPDGNINNGGNVFGLVNQVSAGVYTAGLFASGFNGLPAPNVAMAIQAGNSNTIIIVWNTTSANYPVQIGSGSLSPTSGVGGVQITGDTQKLWAAKRTPASSAATGYLGEVCFDDNFFYIYTSVGWKRTALVAF